MDERAMKHVMSLSARREMLAGIRETYQAAPWVEKGRILDGFVASSGYERKYSIQLLNRNETPPVITQKKDRPGGKKYDEQFVQALLYLWHTANQICSKRLVPFIPELVEAMERHGHLRVSEDIRTKLNTVSAATVDRLLQPERIRVKGGISLTKHGSLLKHQIAVRTFADWNDITPGFFEIDLVAHCGGDPNGAFLNTLVMIDISTGWLECMPLMRKSAGDVISGIEVASTLIPFPLKGLDSDSGSEFINLDLLDYCEDHRITFTRARAYKKNDQAYVEEKNGSVVRRLVGYDRFIGRKAWEALARFYGVLRQYINFFQPSLKLKKKTRQGARVSKQYETAQTAYQRVLKSTEVDEGVKAHLIHEYENLDPLGLMEELRRLQLDLWRYSWNTAGQSKPDGQVDDEESAMLRPKTDFCEHYHVAATKDKRRMARTYRTRKDAFEGVWPEIQFKLELQPESYAREIIDWLSEKYPGEFSKAHTRTLQRRISEWRLKDRNYQMNMSQLMGREVALPLP
jgi:hypothetical protein